MKIAKAARRLPEFSAVAARDAKHLPAWFKAQGKSTIEAKLPWLPFSVIEALETFLTPESKVFEFGGGGSTLWFAKHAGEVVTVEHDAQWFPVLAAAVRDVPRTRVMHHGPEGGYAEYVASISAYPDDYFDVVVVDGRERVRCFEVAMSKVKPSGLLILDDSQREAYSGAFQLAAAWPRKEYQGLAPSKTVAAYTTIWTKPVAANVEEDAQQG